MYIYTKSMNIYKYEYIHVVFERWRGLIIQIIIKHIEIQHKTLNASETGLADI